MRLLWGSKKKRELEAVDLAGDWARPDLGIKKKDKKKKKEFYFNSLDEHWAGHIDEVAYRAFTHSSSFVGNVRYDSDNQTMEVFLNQEKWYNFCNVPERVFDAWEGSDSKGEYFNRSIKGQYDC